MILHLKCICGVWDFCTTCLLYFSRLKGVEKVTSPCIGLFILLVDIIHNKNIAKKQVNRLQYKIIYG